MNHLVTIFIPILLKVGVLYLCIRLPFKLDSDVATGLGAAGKFLYNNGIKKGGAILGTGAYNLRKNLANKAGQRAGFQFDETHKGEIDRLVAQRVGSQKGQDELTKRYEEGKEVLEKSERYKTEKDEDKKKKMRDDLNERILSDFEREKRGEVTARMEQRRAVAVNNAAEKYGKGVKGQWLAWGASLATLPLGVEEAIKINLESLDKVAKKTSQKALLQGPQVSGLTKWAPFGVASRLQMEKPKLKEGATEEEKADYEEKMRNYDEEMNKWYNKIRTSTALGLSNWRPINRRYIQGEYGVLDYSSMILESDMKAYDDPEQVMRYWQQGRIQQNAIKNVKAAYRSATGKEASDEEAATIMRRELINEFLVNDEGKPMWRDSVYAQGMIPWDAMLLKVGFERMYGLARVQSRYGGRLGAEQRKIDVQRWLDSYLAGKGAPGITGGPSGEQGGLPGYGGGPWPGGRGGGPGGGGGRYGGAPSGGSDSGGERPGEVKLDEPTRGLLASIDRNTKQTKSGTAPDSSGSSKNIAYAIEAAREGGVSTSPQANFLKMRSLEQTRLLNRRLGQLLAGEGLNMFEANDKAVALTSELEVASPADVQLKAEEFKKAHPDPEIGKILDDYVDTRYATVGAQANLPESLTTQKIVDGLAPKLKADSNLARNLTQASDIVIKANLGTETVSPAQLSSASRLIATNLPGAVSTQTGGQTNYNVTTDEAIQMSRAVRTASNMPNLN